MSLKYRDVRVDSEGKESIREFEFATEATDEVLFQKNGSLDLYQLRNLVEEWIKTIPNVAPYGAGGGYGGVDISFCHEGLELNRDYMLTICQMPDDDGRVL